ncbi:hypothetical protein DSO57_1034654 [Entomophthora muscae]|uniref:Uncharacterized protein n=1 Tax=Entomophthora muscae TaxID=34485 RepID=A0ACC2SZY9_9FUNG|nr:hypothetical protein DSO57_1034654 [Entomophthora muscae]
MATLGLETGMNLNKPKIAAFTHPDTILMGNLTSQYIIRELEDLLIFFSSVDLPTNMPSSSQLFRDLQNFSQTSKLVPEDR